MGDAVTRPVSQAAVGGGVTLLFLFCLEAGGVCVRLQVRGRWMRMRRMLGCEVGQTTRASQRVFLGLSGTQQPSFLLAAIGRILTSFNHTETFKQILRLKLHLFDL